MNYSKTRLQGNCDGKNSANFKEDPNRGGKVFMLTAERRIQK
jgi:hypothetical protein